MIDDPVRAVDALLDRVAAALGGGPAPTGEPATGSAADGQVAATVGPDGRVREITIDPRLARTPDAIAPAVIAAVNAALAAAPQPATTAVDLAELKDIQAASLELTKQLNASLVTALENLKPSR